MSLGVVVGDLFASVEVGDLLASADRRDKGGMARFTGKRRGEMAEAAFVAKAVSLGFGVAKPWGDSDPFDFIVQAGGKLSKVQVKSAHCVGEDGTYSIRTHGHDMKAYRVDQIDVLVVYVVPENAWYVFPVRVIRRMRSLKLFSGSRKRRSKFEKYREAWGYLRGWERLGRRKIVTDGGHSGQSNWPFSLNESKKDGGPGARGVCSRGPVSRNEDQGHSSMSTVNAERVGLARGPEKKLSATTLTGRNGIVQRYFYFAMSLLLAGIVVAGFSRTINDSLFHPAIPRPFILWIHAAVFGGWVIFFICQSTLVRVHKVSWHRSFGWFGAGLATVMVPLGVATAIIMARFDAVQLHLSDAYSFLSVPFYEMLAFGLCIALAIYWRTQPELHRRLIFIATCGLMSAAFARFDYVFDHKLFYLCVDLVIVLGVARDLLVDRRVHKVYLYALPLLIVGQNLAIYMWRHNPSWWQGITHVIMG